MTDEPSEPTSSTDQAAYWRFRQDSLARVYRRIVETNLLEAQEVAQRVASGSYGLEDWTDDLKSAWSRGSQDVVDVFRILWGLPATPDDVPVVQSTIVHGSQASAPILFSALFPRALTLSLSHLHELKDGELQPHEFLSGENFHFTPAEVDASGSPVEVALRLVGLNQHTNDELRHDTGLAVGRYIGFITGQEAETDLIAVLVLNVVPPSMPSIDLN